MRGLVLAVQFLTRLPLPAIAASHAEFANSMRWFPAVGLIIGAVVAAGGWAGALLDPWIGAIMALLLWVWVTGALHLDGVADVADALGGSHGRDRARLLEVLADPHVGSFGVAAVGLALLAKLVLLHNLLLTGLFWAPILVAAAARAAPLFWTRLPPLHEGLGARFRMAIRARDLLLWGLLLLGLMLCIPAIGAIFLFIPFWGWWVWRRIGGISGDSHGAGIEIGETVLLFAFTLAGHLA